VLLFSHRRTGKTSLIFEFMGKLEKLLKLAAGLKLSIVVDPLTGQPGVSVSLSRSERPKYLKSAMEIVASYAKKEKYPERHA
jgi:hypothetical protein